MMYILQVVMVKYQILITYYHIKKYVWLQIQRYGPKQISREIIDRNLNKIIVVGENLSYDNEKITIAKPEEIIRMDNFDMNVVVILDEE